MTQDYTRERNKNGQRSVDYSLVYPYYRKLTQVMPDIKPWAMFALFVLVFPTGNAISERGFSAMAGIHTKQRSEMRREQVFAHLMIGFNGLNLQRDWMLRAGNLIRLFIFARPNNYNV
jgi:hypothetical protein